MPCLPGERIPFGSSVSCITEYDEQECQCPVQQRTYLQALNESAVRVVVPVELSLAFIYEIIG
jgi:hypothetical protein